MTPSVNINKFDRQLRLFGFNTQMSISSAILYFNLKNISSPFSCELIKNFSLLGFKKIIVSKKISHEYFEILNRAGIKLFYEEFQENNMTIEIKYDIFEKFDDTDAIILKKKNISYDKLNEERISVFLCKDCYMFSFKESIKHRCKEETDNNLLMLKAAFLSQQIVRKISGESFIEEYDLPTTLPCI